MMKWIVSDIFGEKNELLRGRDSFFSGELGGVVVPTQPWQILRIEENHIDIVFLSLDGSNDSCETLLFIRFHYVCYLHYHTLTLLLLDFWTIYHRCILGYLEWVYWCWYINTWATELALRNDIDRGCSGIIGALFTHASGNWVEAINRFDSSCLCITGGV